MLLKGLIHIPEKVIRKEGVFYIRVQDTSMMDMPAETIAEITIEKKPGSEKMPFSLELPKTLSNSASYTLYVHLDLDLDKQLSVGDWLHDRAYHVTPAVQGDLLKVSLAEIT